MSKSNEFNSSLHNPRGERFRVRSKVAACVLAACAYVTLAAPSAGPDVIGAGESARADQVTITLLGTTDLHGNLLPIDYYANKPANRGLAKIATLVRQVRAQQPHVLLLDSGDTIQGTPLAYYFARKDTSKTNPMIAVMNAMGYNAMAVGNHEFNFGLAALLKAKHEATFPFLAANLRTAAGSSAEPFAGFIIKELAGVRVAIVGLITPGVPRWEMPANYRGYEFLQIVETAKRVIPEVRKKADLVVVIAHSGLERESATGRTEFGEQIQGENAVLKLAEEVPGIDVILFGHTHRELPERIVNGALLAQARNWGQSLARADVTLEREAGGAWRVMSKHSTTIPMTDEVAPDAELVKLAEPYHQATQAYLDTPIATSEAAMDGLTARYEDHPFVDLIHRVQMKYGSADVSMATMFLPQAQVPKGKVTVRQAAAIYIYENTLYTVAMTGAQLKNALEHAASFFPAWPFAPDAPLRLPGYNADSAEGVNYVLDLSRPVGERIAELTFRGKRLDPAQKLRVAINNYRYAGGGRYEVYAGLPILYRSPQEIRELLIEYLAETGVMPAKANGNWKIVPDGARAGILREARQGQDPHAVATGGPSR